MDWSSFWGGVVAGVCGGALAFVWLGVTYSERKERQRKVEQANDKRLRDLEFDVKYHNELFFGPLGLISRVCALEQKVDLPKRRKDDAKGATK